MAIANVNPTRMELKKLKVRLTTARKGHKLLKDKRDELMRQFLLVIKESKALRETVEAGLDTVNKSFAAAAALSSPAMLEEALMLPKRPAELNVGRKNVMSVEVPVFEAEIKGAGDSCNYGFAFTPGELDAAAEEIAKVLPDMIKLAESEKTARLLASEIERTRRRVNALEYSMIPQLEAGIKRISMKLEENERGNITRLMKVKDMMLEKTIAERRGKAAKGIQENG